jgi:8-oxo-dGTP diphosphatase
VGSQSDLDRHHAERDACGAGWRLWHHVEVPHAADPEHQVVAGLLRRQGRVLLCHRTPHRRWYPDTWDLPGGHVEAHEHPPQALARELWEELGIVVAPPKIEPFAHVQGSDFRMDVWLIDEWTGRPSNGASDEHDALAWVNAEETPGLQLADARLTALIEAALS